MSSKVFFDCAHESLYSTAGRVPLQVRGLGGCQRSAPTGGSANGTPRKRCTPMLSTAPYTRPCFSASTGAAGGAAAAVACSGGGCSSSSDSSCDSKNTRRIGSAAAADAACVTAVCGRRW